MTDRSNRPEYDGAFHRDKTSLDGLLGSDPTPPWYKRRAIMVVGALGVLFIGAVLLFRGGDAQGDYVTREATRQNLTITVSATGNLQATNEVEVSSEQSGLVTQVYVDINDRVTKGQPLARLDTSRLNDSVVQASASLAAAEAQLEQYRATLAQANADLARVEEVYRLSNGSVPSKAEIDATRAERSRAQAAVRAGQAQIMQTRAQLTTARTELSKATIYSPITGVVLARSVEPGQTVAATLSAPVLFRIAEDLSEMELEVSVDEADRGLVTEGQLATFTVDAYPGKHFDAEITRVDLGANSDNDGSTSSNQVVSYTAVLSIANEDLTLLPGMTATAEIVTQTMQNALVVPNSALRFVPETQMQGSAGVASMIGPGPMQNDSSQEVTIGRGTTRTLYVLGADGQLEARRVTVGSSDGTFTQILSGELEAGDEVVTARASTDGGGSPAGDGPASATKAALLDRRTHAQDRQYA